LIPLLAGRALYSLTSGTPPFRDRDAPFFEIISSGRRAGSILRRQAKDGTTATIKTYGGGKEGSEVVLVAIEGMGHTWPGREPAVQFLGKPTRNVSANEMMWALFQKHPMNR
jgi:hypothetical protein